LHRQPADSPTGAPQLVGNGIDRPPARQVATLCRGNRNRRHVPRAVRRGPSQLVVDAKDAGLPSEEIAAELEAELEKEAAAMRLCMEE
jgi:hypothetical protein